jgi:hypothetical protein
MKDLFQLVCRTLFQPEKVTEEILAMPALREKTATIFVLSTIISILSTYLVSHFFLTPEQKSEQVIRYIPVFLTVFLFGLICMKYYILTMVSGWVGRKLGGKGENDAIFLVMAWVFFSFSILSPLNAFLSTQNLRISLIFYPLMLVYYLWIMATCISKVHKFDKFSAVITILSCFVILIFFISLIISGLLFVVSLLGGGGDI